MVIGGIIWPLQPSRPITFVTTELCFYWFYWCFMVADICALGPHFNALYTICVCWFNVCAWYMFVSLFNASAKDQFPFM